MASKWSGNRRDQIKLVLIVTLVIAIWWPKPTWAINNAIDAVLIPLTLWLCWPEMKKVFKRGPSALS